MATFASDISDTTSLKIEISIERHLTIAGFHFDVITSIGENGVEVKSNDISGQLNIILDALEEKNGYRPYHIAADVLDVF